LFTIPILFITLKIIVNTFTQLNGLDYGVTGKALEITKSPGHNSTDLRACSECHGTGKTLEEKAMSAAPTAGTP
jgi:cytochrome c553